jgi:hypothetical protein
MDRAVRGSSYAVDIVGKMWKICVARIVVSKLEGAIEALLEELQIQLDS